MLVVYILLCSECIKTCLRTELTCVLNKSTIS